MNIPYTRLELLKQLADEARTFASALEKHIGTCQLSESHPTNHVIYATVVMESASVYRWKRRYNTLCYYGVQANLITNQEADKLFLK